MSLRTEFPIKLVARDDLPPGTFLLVSEFTESELRELHAMSAAERLDHLVRLGRAVSMKNVGER